MWVFFLNTGDNLCFRCYRLFSTEKEVKREKKVRGDGGRDVGRGGGGGEGAFDTTG